MIEIVQGSPTNEEVTAIVAALFSFHPETVEGRTKPSAWALAARRPELDMQELRAAVRVF